MTRGNATSNPGDWSGMVFVKCSALVVGLVLALGFVASTVFRGLPEGLRGLLFLALVAGAVWLAILGCRRIVRRVRETRPTT